jgi:hypothetical protein
VAGLVLDNNQEAGWPIHRAPGLSHSFLMERLSVEYGEKLKFEFAIYPAPEVRLFCFLVVKLERILDFTMLVSFTACNRNIPEPDPWNP